MLCSFCEYTDPPSYSIRLSLNILGQDFQPQLRAFQQYLGVNSPVKKMHPFYTKVDTMTTKAKTILRELVQSLLLEYFSQARQEPYN